MADRLRIATRQSPLALWQARYVQEQLQALDPGLTVELVGITTRGDRILGQPLSRIGGKGLFIKELEQALLDGRADMAVHSMKDVPMVLPDGFALPVICEREDPTDAFVSPHYDLEALPDGAVVGTASLRRQCQLKHWRPDLQMKTLRGNVQTRLGKLDAGEFDGIVLATAGLVRLELTERIRLRVPPSRLLPACGQGAVGIEIRGNDTALAERLAPLHHATTACCVAAERAMNRRLEGSCQVPIAGYATLDGDTLTLEGRVGTPDGETLLTHTATGPRHAPEVLGETVAGALLAQGAGSVLAAIEP